MALVTDFPACSVLLTELEINFCSPKLQRFQRYGLWLVDLFPRLHAPRITSSNISSIAIPCRSITIMHDDFATHILRLVRISNFGLRA